MAMVEFPHPLVREPWAAGAPTPDPVAGREGLPRRNAAPGSTAPESPDCHTLPSRVRLESPHVNGKAQPRADQDSLRAKRPRRGASERPVTIHNCSVMNRHARHPGSAVRRSGRSDPPRHLRAAVPRRRADRGRADRPRGGLAAGRLQASSRSEAGRAGGRPPRGAPDPLQRTAAGSRAPDRLDGPVRRLLARPVRSPRRTVEQDGPMTAAAPDTRCLVVERELPHAPEQVWRALTQAPLIEEWLMANDFQPVVGHTFNFRTAPTAHWNGAVDGEVLVVEPHTRLSYSWSGAGEGAADGLRTVVTWTLTPTPV